jgi:Circadian oscillating protein COP23
MNFKSSVIVTSLSLCLISAGLSIAPTSSQPSKKVEFYCSRTSSVDPVTMLVVEGTEPWTIIVWKNSFGQMSPKQRCESVSNKFQAALEGKELERLGYGVNRQNGQGLICAMKYAENKCDLKHMLFAVKNKQIAQEIVGDLYGILRKNTGTPPRQSSSNESINIQELIDAMSKP